MTTQSTLASYQEFTKLYSSTVEIQLTDTSSGQSFDIPLGFPGVRPLALYMKIDDREEMFSTVLVGTAATSNGDTPIYEALIFCSISAQFISKGYDEDTNSILPVDTLRVDAVRLPTSTNTTPLITLTYFIYADSIQ